MKTIHFAGKDYIVYDCADEAMQNGVKFVEYWEAKEGDYVIDANNIVVPLIRKVQVTNTMRRIGNKKYKRAQPHIYYIYTFPQCKFMYRVRNDITAKPKKFYYKTKLGIMQSIYEQTGAKLTPRKMYFALLLANGFPPEVAIGIAHQEKKPKLLKLRMFEYMTCPQTLHYFRYVAINMGTLKEELEKRGISNSSMAERIVQLMDNEEAPAVIRKFALETAIKALDNVPMQQLPNQQPHYLPQGINLEGLKERLQLKAVEVQNG